ncbi:MAG: 2TM domain-containing protein [Acidimicrobiia bacterium]|nr:2TM domain-containing protein [Acidimicrobiia bacterium]
MNHRPDQPLDESELRAAAVQRLHKKREFRNHLTAYVLVNSFLVVIWLSTAIAIGDGAWFPWPIFPIVGWGIGLAFHGRSVYGTGITEGDIQREMDRLRGSGNA